MKPGLYDDLVTRNLIHEIERLKTDGIVPLFGKVEPAQLPITSPAFWPRNSPNRTYH